MALSDEQEAVAAMSRALIGAVAPGELPMFRANSAAFFANPERALKPVKGKDEMIGFGVAEAAAFLTPVAMAMVAESVKFVIEEIKKSAKAESASLISAWVKKLFTRMSPTSPAAATPVSAAPAPAGPELTREQLDRLRRVAVEKARQYVDEQQANRLADELVGRLVTS